MLLILFDVALVLSNILGFVYFSENSCQKALIFKMYHGQQKTFKRLGCDIALRVS